MESAVMSDARRTSRCDPTDDFSIDCNIGQAATKITRCACKQDLKTMKG